LVSETYILETYYPIWRKRMANKMGKDSKLITEENCIEDFCALHYAWEIS